MTQTADPMMLPPDPPAVELAGIELTEVAAYQVLKDTLMKDGVDGPPPPPPQREFPEVAGKEIMFRAFLRVAAGWTPAALYARLELPDGRAVNGAAVNISASSVEGDLKTTLQVDLGATHVVEGLRVAISLHDGTGAPITVAGKALRWPASDYRDLGVKKLGGPFKVTVAPYTWVDGTTKADVKKEDWENFTRSVMPAGEIDIVVLPELPFPAQWNVGEPINGLFLAGVTARRSAEETDPLRHWYGVVNVPMGMAGSTQGIANLPGPGDPAGRAAVGIWDLLSGAGTGIHELGHTLGREHAPCMGEGIADPGYPYPACQIGPWGYSRTSILGPPVLIDPTMAADIMSYGASKQFGWFLPFISDYTYLAFWVRLRTYYGQAALVLPRAKTTYDVVAAVSGGTTGDRSWRWVTRATTALVDRLAENVELLDREGRSMGTVKACFMPSSQHGGGQFWIPASGAASVLLPGDPTPVSLRPLPAEGRQ